MESKDISEEIENLVKKGKNLTKKDILNIPAVKCNPIAPRLISTFTTKEKIDLQEMITSLKILVSKAPLEEKLKVLFKLYDTNKDGKIDSDELFTFLKSLTDGFLDEYKIQNVVDKTFYSFGEYKTFIDFKEFLEIIKDKNPNLEKFFKCNG